MAGGYFQDSYGIWYRSAILHNPSIKRELSHHYQPNIFGFAGIDISLIYGILRITDHNFNGFWNKNRI